MAGDDERDQRRTREGDYRAARIGAAAALVSVLILILILDAIVPDYHVDPVVAVSLLGAVGGLLGVEIIGALRGR